MSARRRRHRAAAGSAVFAAVAVLALLLAPAWGDGVPRASKSLAPSTVQLADGSTATLIDAASEVAVTDVGSDSATLTVLHGGALFDVVPNAERRFVVHASDVTVEALGTQFRVELVAAGVEVEVFEGVVRAEQGGARLRLETGASHRFASAARSIDVDPPIVAPMPPNPAPTAEPPVNSDEPPSSTNRTERSTSWRQLAQAGEYDAAYERLAQAQVPHTVPDLMLAADAARFSGNAARAVEFLRRVRTSQSADPRAPLAAFTEGRILLGQLGRPQEAAVAFAAARRLAPRGSLAEDSLAREVEALSRAGATARAERLAEQYLSRYPNGRRAAAVRHHAGLE